MRKKRKDGWGSLLIFQEKFHVNKFPTSVIQSIPCSGVLPRTSFGDTALSHTAFIVLQDAMYTSTWVYHVWVGQGWQGLAGVDGARPIWVEHSWCGGVNGEFELD